MTSLNQHDIFRLRDLPDTEGLAQAKKSAEKLKTRFAYSTNGVGIYQVDMHTGNVRMYNLPKYLSFNPLNLGGQKFFNLQLHL